MKAISCRLAMLAASGLMLLAAAGASPAYARDFVQDQAKMFSDATVTQLNARIGSFNAQTGKEIVVVTTPSLGGATLQDGAQAAFTQQNVNGVLIFIARDDRRDIIVPDGAAKRWFPPETLRSIRTAMESDFKSENYDAGITGAVGTVLNVYRQHLGSLGRPAGAVAGTAQRSASSLGGFHISMFWWIIIAIVGFLILRSILRAASAPRSYGGGPAAPPGAPPGPGGYGPGYGYGGYGGGGSFWSGLLGGLGGAWLGNELFRAGGGIAPAQGAQIAPDAGGVADSSGWQSDPGQADMSGASSGDWSGGGFGDGGGDFGGGGGDSGGGW
jgi:uncharacterized membrane protein YgcG